MFVTFKQQPLFELSTLFPSKPLIVEPLFSSLLPIVEEGEITSKTGSFSGFEWCTAVEHTR